MNRRIHTFGCNWIKKQNKFKHWVDDYDELKKKEVKDIKGKTFSIEFNSYPFVFGNKENQTIEEMCKNIYWENYKEQITLSGTPDTREIAEKIMGKIAEHYAINKERSKKDKSIECIHCLSTLSVEGFDIDSENGTIGNIFIGS